MALLGQGPLVKATCIYFALLSLLLIPFVQREAVFMHNVRWPPFAAYHSPEKYGFMPGAWRSFHIPTPDGVNIGATQVLPFGVYEQALAQQHNKFNEPLAETTYDDALLSERPTILYLHGNAANRLQRSRRELSRSVAETLNCNFLVIDYRSFGDSDRVAPSEDGLVLDARGAWNWLTQTKGVDPSQIAIMGHSLGTGVASRLAADLAEEGIQPRALILSAPFASFRMLLRTYRLFTLFPILSPFRSVPKLQNLLLDFLQTRFDTYSVLPRSNCPLLIQHALNDANIPALHSRGLVGMLAGLKPNTDKVIDEIAMQPTMSTPAVQLGAYGQLHELQTAQGRRLLHLESVYGGHEAGQNSQMMLHYIKDIMQIRLGSPVDRFCGMYLTLTLVRHGQSVDNTKQLWAGHKDSPLTNRGIAQATALGQAIKRDSVDKIYCSDLKRAKWTALEIHKACNSLTSAESAITSSAASDEDGRPSKRVKSVRRVLTPPIEHEIFREQNFGLLEGADWTDMRASGSRHAGFEGGESSSQVARRAKTVVERVVKPWILHSSQSKRPKHIVIVAHGIFNTALRSALVALDPEAVLQPSYSMPNTGYHRFRLSSLAADLDLDEEDKDQLAAFTENATALATQDFKLAIEQVDIRVRHLGMFSDHLKHVKKMGVLGSVAWSPQQRSVADMFSKR